MNRTSTQFQILSSISFPNRLFYIFNVNFIKKTYSRTISYTLLVALFVILGGAQIWGQAANTYTFSTSTGAAVINPTYTTIVTSGNDDAASTVRSIGFTFVYEGVSYTQFSANSNGLMRLGGTAVSTAYTNDVAATGNEPKIMPHWDDHSTASNGNVRFGVSGSSPNRICVVDFNLYSTSSTSSNSNMRFQVRLYETTNVIEFMYSGTGTTSSSASIGIGGVTSTNYMAITNTNTHTASASGAINTHTTWPGSGRMYTFAPCVVSTAPTSITGTSTICTGPTTLTSAGGTLGTDAVDVWYAGACGTDAYINPWTINSFTSGANQTTFNSVTGGYLKVTSASSGGDAFIHMPGLGSFNPNTYKYINVRFRVTSVAQPSSMQIFWYNTLYTGANGAQYNDKSFTSTQNVWQTVSIDMSSPTAGNWLHSNVTGWRFDWTTSNSITMDIDFITLSTQPMIGSGPSITVSPTVNTTYYTSKEGACGQTTCASQLVTVGACCTAPTSQASIGNYSSVGTTSATVNWTRGTGNKVLVVGRLTSATLSDPVSATAYTANAAFGSGTQIGTGNFVVYDGTASSVNVTNLVANSKYSFTVYEYNTTGTCYLLPGSGSDFKYGVTFGTINTGSSTWCAGETRSVTVQVTNSGNMPWTSGSANNVNFSYWWTSTQTQDANTRIAPFANLTPGSSQTITFNITAPAAGSNTALNFDLVKEAECWYRGNSNSCGPGNNVGSVTGQTIAVAPTSPNAGADVAICAGASTQLSGSAVGPSVTTTGSQTFNYSGTDYDDYNFTIGGTTSGMPVGATITSVNLAYSTGNSCSWSSMDLYINNSYINSYCSGSQTYNGLNGSAANGQKFEIDSYDEDAWGDYITMTLAVTVNYTYTVASAVTYAWTPSGTLDNAAIANPIATPSTTTDYIMTATSGSCSVKDTVKVTATPLAMTGTVTLCIGATSDLAVTGETDWTLPTGGTITTAGNDRIHSFTSSGTFNTAQAISGAKVLVIGGGGGGGQNGGGGGGAGAYIYNTSSAINSGNTTVTIGGGGASGGSPAANGGNSVFGTTTALGGGGGASRDAGAGGQAGGSGGGGGGATASPRHLGGAGTAGQGNNGGNGTTPDASCNAAGGGGGGAGGPATNAANNNGGTGGIGVQNNITGSNLWYAAGGGGGTTNFNVGCGPSSCNGTACSSIINGNGGSGIGGNGESTAGTANTGSGGGAERAGGSGVVIVRYTIPKWTSSNTSVATVNEQTGLVTAVAAGTTTITYLNEKGCQVANTVTVLSAASNVVLSSSSVSSAVEQCEESGWTYYADPSDATKWLFAIFKNGNTFSPSVNITVKSTSPVEYDLKEDTTNFKAAYTLGRYWNVASGAITGTNPMKVRFFANASDITTMEAAANAWATANPCTIPGYTTKVGGWEWFKTVGTAYNPSSMTASGTHAGSSTLLKFTASYGTLNGVDYMQYDGITSFSGGSVGIQVYPVPNANSPVPLPVKLTSFTANAVNNSYIKLDWTTAIEIDNKGFEVERSIDGQNFTLIGWVDGYGNSTELKTYTFDDKTVDQNTMYYYRLKQIDFDGDIEYSNIVSVAIKGERQFILTDLYPNPATQKATIAIATDVAQKVKVNIYDLLGQLVINSDWSVGVGTNSLDLDLSSMASGTYSVALTSANQTITKKLVIAR